MAQPLIGTALNHYRITAILGSGGMGEVYAADDTKLGRAVAIKLLPPAVAGQPERRRRFEHEARAIAALNHPNIVTVHSIEQAGEHTFLTMELVRGKLLAEPISQGALSIERLLALAIPLADGVSAAHERGVIHRDLKPANVMVTHDGHVKILDFGVARLTKTASVDGGKDLTTELATGELEVMGTVAYMSPEQAEGRTVDARSDIFSLGVSAYQMWSFELPWPSTDTTGTGALQHDSRDPTPIDEYCPTIQPTIAKTIMQCLAADPNRRPPTAETVVRMLRNVTSDEQ